MKKLMFGFAALVAATSLAAIESANVVGYSQSGLKAGYTATGAQFVSMDGKAMDLCDIVPTGYDRESYVGGSITIQLLDATGRMVPGSAYYWYDDEDGTAWFDGADDEIVPGAITLAPGEAMWVTGNSTSEGLQTAGQVANVSIDIALRAGYKLLCNPTPVAVNWNDDDENGKMITCGGYDPEEYIGGSIDVQLLDATGRMVPGSAYYWYDDEDGTGWFDGADEFVEGVKLPAGVGIWIKANSTNEKITFPGAL